MSNKYDRSPKKDDPARAPQSAGPDLAEDDRERQADHGGEADITRRNQSIQDRSRGAPVTGMPGSPKSAGKR